VIAPEPHALPDLVRELHRQAAPWLPAGQATRLRWGPPVQPGVGQELPTVVSTSRLNRILEHAAGDFTVTVEAGLPLQHLQEALMEQRQWLALDWPWGSGADGEGAGTVGGLVARGMAGGLRQRHLGVRDQLIGIGLLRTDGTAARAGGRVVKNVAGYDLMRLLTGSWGSLALITELTLRTVPLPPQRRGLLLQGEPQQLEPLRRRLLAAALGPELLDWWSAPLAETAGQPPLPGLLLGLASVSGEAIADQLAAIGGEADAAGVRRLELDSERLEALRAVALGPDQGCGPVDGPRTGRWLLRLGVLPAEAAALLADPLLAGLRLSLAAGSGLGLAWAEATQLPTYRVEALRRRCRVLGGQLTVLEQPAAAGLPAWEDAPSRPLIEAVKRQFDPLQQLARGRLPGVHTPSGLSL